MNNKNTQIAAYNQSRELKKHELEMLELIGMTYVDQKFSFLDIGCADGLFCEHLKKRFINCEVTGVDLSGQLIKRACERKITDATFEVRDAVNLDLNESFDCIVAAGILSVFDDYELALKEWLKYLKDGGKLYIFGRFNSMNIDTKIEIRNNFNNSDWEGGLTSYSTHTVGKFLNKNNYSYKFKKFVLDINLEKNENPIRTYTVDTVNGEKLIINGANILAEFFFLTIGNKN